MKNFLLTKKTFVASALIALVFIASRTVDESAENGAPDCLQSALSRAGIDNLPLAENDYFFSAGHCDPCHGHDTAGFASLDSLGNDVNVVDDWRATMMANSAKDPFWRAKVSHETLINPGLQEEIENKCTACHAPMGRFAANYSGRNYSILDLERDTVGLDGVSCDACHRISENNLGELFSGEVTYDSNNLIYGPYTSPYGSPMVIDLMIVPSFSPHISDAGLCASCHTLITHSVDLNGNPTGSSFVEQATYHEWLNSNYNKSGITCQNCHLPQIEDPILLAAGYEFLVGRTPYGLHEMVGGNTFMLQLMKEHKEQLGIAASDEQFDSTIAATFRMLQDKSLDVAIQYDTTENDPAKFAVSLTNKVGHKFPSGYPSRRAFVEFLVFDANNDTLFKSGVLRSDYEVENHSLPFEPHYNVIRSSDEVQVYELVQGDVNGDFTTVLLRAHSPLKDNRLPPLGFTTFSEVYDTTLIVGNAVDDADFNKDAIGEGTGKDVVHYHVALNGYDSTVTVSAKVYYQSLPPNWMKEIFEDSTEQIDTFRNMYNAADQSPVLVASAGLEDVLVHFDTPTSINDPHVFDFRIFPNPSSDGIVHFEFNKEISIESISVLDVSGKLARQVIGTQKTGFAIKLPPRPGIYLLQIKTRDGLFTERILRL